MEFDYARLIYLLILLSFVTWHVVVKRKFSRDSKESLIKLLSEAELVLLNYSDKPSAEEFKLQLKVAIQEYTNGKSKMLEQFYTWFAPKNVWDNVVGDQGEELRIEISELITSMRNSWI